MRDITCFQSALARNTYGSGFRDSIEDMARLNNALLAMNPQVIPIVAGLIALVTVAGSLPAIRMVLRLRPAEVLHGGH